MNSNNYTLFSSSIMFYCCTVSVNIIMALRLFDNDCLVEPISGYFTEPIFLKALSYKLMVHMLAEIKHILNTVVTSHLVIN
jgi:hypothetical protein